MGYGIRKISPQEVRANKRIHKKGLYKRYALRVSVLVTSLLVLSLTSYLFLNLDSLKKQVAFSEPENVESFVEGKASTAEKSVAGASANSVGGYKFVATDQRLEISKLNIIGNIIYPISDKEVDKNLDSGIVYLFKFVLPGNVGNYILTAHSSSVRGGYYSDIFPTLNKLENGDVFFIYRGKEVCAYDEKRLAVYAERVN